LENLAVSMPPGFPMGLSAAIPWRASGLTIKRLSDVSAALILILASSDTKLISIGR
jgi:hypothetical protein